MIAFIKIVAAAIIALEVFTMAAVAGLVGMAAYYGYLKCH
jgi:hypothetical protein